jgi:hypothetical protein
MAMQAAAIYIPTDDHHELDSEAYMAQQYLMSVQKEAQSFPSLMISQTQHSNEVTLPSLHRSADRLLCNRPWKPWAQWVHQQYQITCSSLRSISHKPQSSLPSFPKKKSSPETVDKCSKAWIHYCVTQAVSVPVVASLDQVQTNFLLETLTEAIVEPTDPKDTAIRLCQWIYALLHVLEKPLLADAQSCLHGLSRHLQSDQDAYTANRNLLIVLIDLEFGQGRPLYR